MAKYYVIGDIHGSINNLISLLHCMELDADTYVIMCGDVGIQYGYIGTTLPQVMKQYPCTFIVMRGNHDTRYWKYYSQDHESCEIFEQWGNKFLREKNYPNVWYVRDEGGLYEIPELGSCLFVPGAYSIDKYYRLRSNLPYEEDEQLTYSEMDKLVRIAKTHDIDYVFSHTCPKSWILQFVDLFLPGVDESQVDHSMEKMLDIIYEQIQGQYQMWFFGHYHDDRVIRDDDILGIMLYHKFAEIGGYSERQDSTSDLS